METAELRDVATSIVSSSREWSDPHRAHEHEPDCTFWPKQTRGKLGPVVISAVSAKIEALLDEKIEGVAITAPIIEGD